MNPVFLKRFAALGLAVILLVTASAGGGTSAAAGGAHGAQGLVRAIAAQEAHTNALLAKAGVVGTAVGLGGDGSPVVVVLTESSGVGGLPRSLDGVRVVPQVTGKITALKPGKGKGGGGKGGGTAVDRTARFDRPVPIGVSTGHPDITAGTIGARVTDGSSVYALSNNHVYANENAATVGDAVIQPGTFDGGWSPADDIGTLYDFEPIDFTGRDNVMDAAIAVSSTSLLGNATPPDGYGAPTSTAVAESIGLKVQKYGRTTGLTKGRVWLINATVNVGYSTGIARFVDQIVVRGSRFSAPGDSGSLVTDQARNPVGLLFAGSDNATIINPIGPILARFGVAVDGS